MPLTTAAHHGRAIDGALLPDDPLAVEAATTLFGQGTPELVVRPETAEGVGAAVRAARENGLPLTVRSGGHSMAGASTASAGLLLDLRLLNSVEIEPQTRLVRIGGGACWGQVATALQPHGLGLTAGDTAGVGVGGLTLGGGVGWMVRKHGLAIDNLVGAEIVTADGTIHEVSAEAEPELFWAVRGGGAGFGVVTRFDFCAQEVDDVVFGTVVYGLEDAPALLAAWQHAQQGADERLTTTLSLLPAMGDRPSAAMLGLCFAGPEGDADEVLKPFLSLGTVLSNDVSVRPYAEVLETGEHAGGMSAVIDNVLLPALDEQTAADLAQLGATGTVVSLRALGGAFARVAPDATAFGYRSAKVMVSAIRFSPGPERPSLAGVSAWSDVTERGIGSYLNFRSEITGDVHTAEAAARLARIKGEHDPAGVFGGVPSGA